MICILLRIEFALNVAIFILFLLVSGGWFSVKNLHQTQSVWRSEKTCLAAVCGGKDVIDLFGLPSAPANLNQCSDRQ